MAVAGLRQIAAVAPVRATLAAVRDQLTQDGRVSRVRSGAAPLGEQEGAFLLRGFVRAACGTPGLLSEEFDVIRRQLRGNLPRMATEPEPRTDPATPVRRRRI